MLSFNHTTSLSKDCVGGSNPWGLYKTKWYCFYNHFKSGKGYCIEVLSIILIFMAIVMLEFYGGLTYDNIIFRVSFCGRDIDIWEYK